MVYVIVVVVSLAVKMEDLESEDEIIMMYQTEMWSSSSPHLWLACRGLEELMLKAVPMSDESAFNTSLANAVHLVPKL